MAKQLFVNISASSVSQALVRSVTDMTPVGFPELVIGDGRSYELYLVDGLGNFASFSGNGAYIPFIAIGECGYPTGGTAVWTFSGHSTAALAWDVSPSALQTALQALVSIGANNCSVSGVAGQYYIVTFIGALGDSAQPEITVDFSNLLPASTVDISTIVTGDASHNCVQLATLQQNPITFADDWTPITNGWTGSLSSRTLEIIEAFAQAGGTITDTFQITVADPSGVRSTYVKVPASIQCTIIDPESFAGADKPLLATQAALDAAILGLGNFTFEALTSSSAGNTNITPTTTSRHHTAVVTVSGAAGTRTFSILTSNSPNSGDTVLAVLKIPATAGIVIQVYNATTGGTLLAQFTSNGIARTCLVMVNFNGTAWNIDLDQSTLLYGADNLAGLASNLTAQQNIGSLFSNIVSQNSNFTITTAQIGTLFRVTNATVATLPSAVTAGLGFLVAIQKFDSTSTGVTTSPATVTLNSVNQLAILQSDGSNWNAIIVYNPLAGITSPTAYNADTLNSGDLQVNPSTQIYTEVVTVGGTARTSNINIADTGRSAGDLAKLRLILPSTSAIVLLVNNASSLGTNLFSLTTDGTGRPAYLQLYFDGTSWQPDVAIYPTS